MSRDHYKGIPKYRNALVNPENELVSVSPAQETIATASGIGGGQSAVPSSVEIEVVSSSQSAGSYNNGVEYIPLLQGNTDDFSFQFRSPFTGTAELKLLYSMSAANSGDIEMAVDKLVISPASAVDATTVSGTPFTFTPGNDTDLHILDVSDSSEMSFSVSSDDLVRLDVSRRTDSDTHTGDFRLLHASVSKV